MIFEMVGRLNCLIDKCVVSHLQIQNCKVFSSNMYSLTWKKGYGFI